MTLPSEDQVPGRFDQCVCGHWRFYHDQDEKAACQIVNIVQQRNCTCEGFRLAKAFT